MANQQTGARGPIIVVLLTVLAIWGGDRLLFDHSHDYTVTAEFKDAAGLTKNSSVKIGGIAGGRVKDLQLTGHDTAKVTMELKKGAYPIGVGATAASRPVNLLGEKYVDLDPGNLDKPLPSGVNIPLSRTSRPVELDDVLNTLQPDVRARLRILINEAGIALSGQGANFNAVINEFPSALDQTAKLVDSFSADNRRLANLIEESDRVLGRMSPARDDLASLVSSAANTLKVTADNRVNLAQTVRNAPGALAQLRSTLTQLASTADQLEPFGTQLRRATAPLSETLQELPSFQKQASPALASLRSVSPSLVKLGEDTRVPVRRLRPTSRRLATFATKLKPIVASFDQHAMKNMLGLMDGWSRTIAKSDGLGHVFGLRIIFDKTLLTSLVDRYVGPNLGTRKATSHSEAPAGRAVPSTDTLTGGASKSVVNRLPKPVGKVLGGVGNTVGKVVPKATETVTNIVDALTGKPTKKPDPEAGRSAASDANTLLNYLVGP